MKVQKIEERDFDGVKKLLDELNYLSVQDLPNFFKIAATTDEQIRKVMNDTVSEFLVAKENNKVIGVVEIYHNETKDIPVLIKRQYIYIQNLIVDKKYRREGVGNALLNAVKQWGAERGVHDIRLSVIPSNESAIDFYIEEGFKPIMYSMELS